METRFRILNGDSLKLLKKLPANSIDSCVCDPPYHLTTKKKGGSGPASLNLNSPAGRARVTTSGGFMGMKWDGGNVAFRVELWQEVFRVLKPGAHLLAFGGTRTYHRMVCAIEDAGFEIRDQIGWLYGSGFPKSLNVSKAIDKSVGATRKVIGNRSALTGRTIGKGTSNGFHGGIVSGHCCDITSAQTRDAQQWEGWGTALKPAWEPIVLARKPMVGTVAANVLRFGTGAINIDESRVNFSNGSDEHESKSKNQHRDFGSSPRNNRIYGKDEREQTNYNPPGRWPANIIHDGSEEVLAEFPKTTSGAMKREVAGYGSGSMFLNGRSGPSNQHGDTGSAARFFYCAKASKRDRDEGLDIPAKHCRSNNGNNGSDPVSDRWTVVKKNNHPTVKPTALMRYLVRLVTPPGGTVLDCFVGSGSTGKATILEGFSFIGIELQREYAKIARARIKAAVAACELH